MFNYNVLKMPARKSAIFSFTNFGADISGPVRTLCTSLFALTWRVAVITHPSAVADHLSYVQRR